MFNFKVVTPEKTYLEGEASMVAVSYTHLTLPTNC